MSHRYFYECGDRVEVREGPDEWTPAKVIGRFVGPQSGWPIYILDGIDPRYRYDLDLRPAAPESLRVAP